MFRQFLLESGRENTLFEEYDLSDLDDALTAFYVGALKVDGSLYTTQPCTILNMESNDM